MIFRYEFIQKLDLTTFRKQAEHYISILPNLGFYLIFPDYRIEVDLIAVDESNAHNASIHISEITRDSDGEIANVAVIYPRFDLRFKEIKSIIDLFPLDNHYKVFFESNNVSKTVDTICSLAKVLFKINSLKAFL